MISRLWRFLALFARALMACRVSLISALGGLALFGLVLQAQNLLADLSFNPWLHWPWFFFAVFFFWAFPVHYAARRVLEEDGWLIATSLRDRLPLVEQYELRQRLRHELEGVITWLPRVLGVVPFFAVGVGLWFANDALTDALALDVARRAQNQIFWLGVADLVVAALFIVFVVFRQPLIAWLTSRSNRQNEERVERGLSIFTRLSVLTTALIFVCAYFAPHFLAALIPRAVLIPFLFGSLVLALSLLVRRGYEYGLPVLAPILALAALITATNIRFNDLRTLKGSPDFQRRQIEVKEAVARWRAANDCKGVDDCPPALIVAAEGGASRAAFMEASLIGEIIDRSRAPSRAPGRKIFAISGVSGGAYGGAVIRAALADAAEGDNAPPCRVIPRTWFGARREPATVPLSPNPLSSWRACLQMLTSGDYLSSGFIGLGFRDTLAPRQWFVGPEPWFDDRAALLEQSWEAFFDYVAGRSSLLETGYPCGPESSRGLCRPLGYQPRSGWLPLLLLNGTSVETGRRIIATDLVSTVEQQNKDSVSRVPLYSAAFDLFEMMSAPCAEAKEGQACPHSPVFPADDPNQRNAPDVRLSTAALISARFPIISPAGAIRTKTDAAQGDRVVDGGYFENAGLTTALDLATALHNEGVRPAILWLRNDPFSPGEDMAIPPRPAATPDVGALDESLATRLLGILSSPLDSLLATREGHGAEAADLAVRTLAAFNGPDKLGFYKIGVQAQLAAERAGPEDVSFDAECGALAGKKVGMTKVSMSWWLSAAVQADLDAQLCDKKNRGGLDDLLKTLAAGK
jgi:hypothetical protein